MEINELQNLALEIKELYDSLNSNEGRNKWELREYVEGLVGDIGDLTKLVMAKENFREIEDYEEKLKHEIVDCLWAILIIAKLADMDLNTEFPKQMEKLKNRIKGS